MQTCEAWIEAYDEKEMLLTPTKVYELKGLENLDRVVHFFGDNVAFNKETWLREGR